MTSTIHVDRINRMIRWRLDPGQIEVVDDAVADALRHKTPAEKLAIAFDAQETLRLRIEGALRTWHPDWSADSIYREVARRMTRETK